MVSPFLPKRNRAADDSLEQCSVARHHFVSNNLNGALLKLLVELVSRVGIITGITVTTVVSFILVIVVLVGLVHPVVVFTQRLVGYVIPILIE